MSRKQKASHQVVILPNGKTWDKPPTKIHRFKFGENRNAIITVSYTVGQLPVKLYCLGRVVKENGIFKTMKVHCPSVNITCRITGENSGRVCAQSFCKPQDQFCSQTGVHLAMKHLFRHDKALKGDTNKQLLNYEDRCIIMQQLCPWLFKKKLTPAVVSK